MGNWQTTGDIRPIGGLNARDPDEVIPIHQGTEFKNVDLAGHSLRKRSGFVRQNDLALPKGSLYTDLYSNLSVTHDPWNDPDTQGNISLKDKWTIEFVFTLNDLIPLHRRQAAGEAHFSDGLFSVYRFCPLGKIARNSSRTRVKNFIFLITDSDNSLNGINNPTDSNEVSEGAFKLWFEADVSTGTPTGLVGETVYIHPVLSDNPTIIEPGETYHVLVTRYEPVQIGSANERIELWVNGVKQGTYTIFTFSSTFGEPNNETGGSMTIGYAAWNTAQDSTINYGSRSLLPFSGKVNEIRIRDSIDLAGAGANSPDILTYYNRYGQRGLTSSDGNDGDFQDSDGNTVNIYGSLSYYLKLNEGSGLPEPTKGGATSYIYSSGQYCAWHDGFSSSDSLSSIRFGSGKDMIIAPNAYLYRDQDPINFEYYEPHKTSFRVRFKTPVSFRENAGSTANEPHSTIWFACANGGTFGGPKDDTFNGNGPNDPTEDQNQHIWFWVRVRADSADRGKLELVMGYDELQLNPPGANKGYNSWLSTAGLDADTEYAFIWTVFNEADRANPGTYEAKIWLVRDPDGSPVVVHNGVTLTRNAFSARSDSSNEDARLKYTMTIGELPALFSYLTSPVNPGDAEESNYSVTKEDPNGISMYIDYLDHRYPYLIDEISIFKDIVCESQQEALDLSVVLSPSKIASYGSVISSHWSFNEAEGDFVEDRGALGNHLTATTRFFDVKESNGIVSRQLWGTRPAFKAEPVVRWGSALVDYENESSSVYLIREYRRKTGSRSIVVGGSGTIYTFDGSAFNPIFEGVDALGKHWQSFIYNDFLFMLPPEGDMLKAIGTYVVKAGVDPPAYIAEVPSVGGFQYRPDVSARDSSGIGELYNDSVYRYTLTYFSARTGIESAPGPILTIRTGGTAGSADSGIVIGKFGETDTDWFLPKPPDSQVTHYRVYRTRRGGGTFYFEEQYPITNETIFLRKHDDDLGDSLEALFNLSPPKLRMGTMYRGRAFYAGNGENPQRLYFSRIGFPEYVPSTYFVDLADDDGTGIPIRSIKTYRDRIMVWTDQGSYLVIDTGADVTLDSPQDPPIAVVPLQFDDGCTGRSAKIEVTGMGTVVSGIRGLYVSAGEQMYYVSSVIDQEYHGYDLTLSDEWQLLHWRLKDVIVMGIPVEAYAGMVENSKNKILLWNYHLPGRPFSIWTVPAFTVIAKVRNETTDQEEIWIGDSLGYLWKYDENEDWDGVGDSDWAAGASSDILAGNVLGGAANYVDLGDSSGSAFTLTGLSGDKGRGLLVTILYANGSRFTRRVTRQDDTGGSGGSTRLYIVGTWTTPTANDTWMIGAIDFDYTTGWVSFGDPFRTKKLHHIEVIQEVQSPQGSVSLGYQWREDSSETLLSFLNDATRIAPGPIYGSGDRIRFSMRSYDPRVPIDVQRYSIGFFTKARRPYQAAT